MANALVLAQEHCRALLETHKARIQHGAKLRDDYSALVCARERQCEEQRELCLRIAQAATGTSETDIVALRKRIGRLLFKKGNLEKKLGELAACKATAEKNNASRASAPHDSDLQRSQQHAKREAQELERELEERREQSEAAAAAKERVARKHAENDELARALQAVQMQESQLRAQSNDVETEVCWVAGEQDDARGKHCAEMDSMYSDLMFNGGVVTERETRLEALANRERAAAFKRQQILDEQRGNFWYT
ncbi:hypothetical protein T484DRAFT_1889486 [Baffinella frigidus]|nr:hypothetical protein T484DRAFT_1889486 [Cryptophyta sp. CCMP2293]